MRWSTAVEDFDERIQLAAAHGLHSAADLRWTALLPELLPTVADRAAFVEWATHHPKWRFNVADVTVGVCAKPTEAAIVILSDIVAEILET